MKRLLNEEEAHVLQVPASTAAFHLEHVFYDLDDQPVSWGWFICRGDEPLQIVEECNAGMRQVGERYEQGQYFLSGLIMAGEIFREVVEIVQPVIVNRIVKQVVRHKPDIVGLSGVLTASFEVMRETVSRLRQMQSDGHSFPIIIGGGMIDDQVCHYVGADQWVADAMNGVHLCRQLIKGEH